MKHAVIATILVGVLLLSGCANTHMARQLETMEQRFLEQEKTLKDCEKRLADQSDRLALQEKRLEEQERENESLKKELATTKRGLDATIAGKVTDAIREPGIQAELQKMVAQNIDGRLEEFRRRQARDGGGGGRWEDRRAEWRARREEREKQELEKLAVELKLNEDQQQRLNEHVADIRERVGETFRRMREGGDFNLEEIKATVEDLKHRNDAVMKGILTAEQYAVYQTKPNPLDGIYNFLTGRGGRGRGRRDEREEQRE